MIKELTKEQLNRIPEYRDKWLKIGLSTDRCNRKEAEKWASEVYKLAGMDAPKGFIWTGSPLDSAIAQLSDQVWGQTGPQVSDQVRFQIWDQVKFQVRFHMRSQVNNQVSNQVWDQLSNQVSAQVWDQVRSHVWGQMWDYQVRSQVWDQVSAQRYGVHDSPCLSYYNFFLEVMNLECCEEIIPVMKLAENCGWWAPYKDICFLQEKPSKISMVDGLLHSEGSAAIEYEDVSGLKVWALYGVRVPQWLAETNLEDLDLKKILEIESVDVRSVGLKRFGPERIIQSGYGEVIEDDWENSKYKLIDLSELFPDYEYAPHLYMENASIPGLIHCEGVPPEIQTIEQAHRWREDRMDDTFNKIIHT